MASSAILLVEDHPDDEALTLRAFRKNERPPAPNPLRPGANTHR